MIDNLKKRAAAALLAGTMMVSGSSLGKGEDPLRDSQIDHHQKQANYFEYIYNEDLSDYDESFVDFYRNGYLVINDKEYSFNDLYLELGLSNDVESIFLVYYRFPQSDILTGQEKGSFKRTNILLFKNSYAFYNLYLIYKDVLVDNRLVVDDNNINELINLVQNFDGTIHVEVPETSYGKVLR